MLLPRREREAKSSAAIVVHRLTSKPARHLAHKFLARGDHSGKWAAVAWRHAKALAFHRDDVRFDRRANRAERYRFRNRNDHQRFLSVRNLRNFRDGLDHAEEIRRLCDDTGSVVMHQLAQRIEIHLSGRCKPDFDNFHA